MSAATCVERARRRSLKVLDVPSQVLILVSLSLQLLIALTALRGASQGRAASPVFHFAGSVAIGVAVQTRLE